MEKPLAQEIIQNLYSKYKAKEKNPTIMGIANKAELPYTTVYSVLFGGRNCNAEIFLRICAVLKRTDYHTMKKRFLRLVA